MDLLTSLKISSSGLTANKKRMAAITSNIANAEVTRTAEGGAYKPKEVVFGSEPARENFADILEGELEEKAQTVHATEIVNSRKPPVLKYQPNHPDANPEGNVAYPNINTMEEMANMIEASRAYEANINAMGTAKAMAIKDLEIGRN
ncbi:MAG: flagellar basal body rod protein FlgC [Bacteriovoracaceae bacterium]|nr:flagellar basal body rod protein FlgC [Bacteriovoracaceae bacterium]